MFAARKTSIVLRALPNTGRSLRVQHIPSLARFNSTLQESPVESRKNATPFDSGSLESYHTKLAKQMIQYSKRRNPNGLKNMSNIFQEMEEKSIKFNLDTWVYKLQMLAMKKDVRKLLATFDQILQRYTPSVEIFNVVIKALATEGSITEQVKILSAMREKGVKPDAVSYYNMLRNLHDFSRLEQALDIHETALSEGIRPNALSYDHIIRLCGEVDELDLGWKLLQDADKSNLPLNVTPSIGLPLLRSAAKLEKLDIVQGIWELIQRKNLRLPDDGTAIMVMNLAGKSGNIELASNMIDCLGNQGYQYQEHHFAPLVQAFVRQGDLKGAFSVLEIMRSCSISPTKHTASAIFETIEGDLEKIDQAFYILEQLKQEGKEIDTIAFNVVLGACVRAKDLHRSISTYQEAAKLNVQPNIDTYNYALDACLIARNRQMGDLILTHMKDANVRPNIATFTKRIMLACTQKDYEDAFLYLEEMKQYNIIPPRVCYEHLVKKLVRESDPRVKVALDEMETFGLEITPYLREYIANKGRRQDGDKKPSS
ncbi:hypothetical protein VKS41_006738 [Umbelopsis sp. WA50703]